MLPFYELLRELDDIRLAPNLLEPPLKRNGLTVAGGVEISRDNSTSSVPSLGGRSTTDLAGISYNQNFSINIESNQPGNDTTAANAQVPTSKEVPVWMRTSTVGDVPLESYDMSNEVGIVLPKFTIGPASTSSKVTEDLHTLLAAEKTLKSPPHPSSAVSKATTEESSDDDSDLEEVHMVEVEGKSIALTDVTPDLVAKMSAEEKAKYIEVSQQMVAMYD